MQQRGGDAKVRDRALVTWRVQRLPSDHQRADDMADPRARGDDKGPHPFRNELFETGHLALMANQGLMSSQPFEDG